ncbi:MAG: hypothetical protein H0T73_05435 [Ardenticatenales bacterium]|nr:hypothetical protein [Ardenticatenales bacterium]
MKHPIDRRALFRTLSLLVLGSCLGEAAQAKQGLTLSQFLRLSALLTGFESLDGLAGQHYLAELHRQRGRAARLRVLYEQLGLASATPPASLDELSDELLFARQESSLLAEEIVTFWCEQRYRAFSSSSIFTSRSASSG